MNLLRALGVAGCVAATGTVLAQTCSGGADGGMDATGCQCNGTLVTTTIAAGNPPAEILQEAAQRDSRADAGSAGANRRIVPRAARTSATSLSRTAAHASQR